MIVMNLLIQASQALFILHQAHQNHFTHYRIHQIQPVLQIQVQVHQVDQIRNATTINDWWSSIYTRGQLAAMDAEVTYEGDQSINAITTDKLHEVI